MYLCHPNSTKKKNIDLYMATLEKIRNRAGLLIIVIGVALFAFIIGDGLRSGSTLLQMSKNAALVIDGEKIKIEDYSQRLTEMQEVAEAGGQRLSDEQRIELNNQLAQEYVQNAALTKEAEALGLTVTPEELTALFTGNGASQSYQAQQFFSSVGVNAANHQDISNFLTQISDNAIKAYPAEQQAQLRLVKMQWEAVVRTIKAERLNSKFSSIMTRSYAINKIDAKYLSGVPSRDVAVVRTPSTILADTMVRATDKEVREYYDKHPRLFEQKFPNTKVNLINVEIRPSAQDYAAAETEMKEVRNRLAQTTDVADVVRNYSNSFAPDFFLNEEELSQVNLPASLVDFVKNSEEGAVNTPIIENDNYALIKLVAKKTGPAGLYARIIVLDSINNAKSDSLINAINGGSDFAELASLFSADPQTKATGGYLTFPKQNMGTTDTLLTESMATQIGLDTLYQVPVGKAFAMQRGAANFILQVVKAAPVTNKYKVAYIGLPVTFSDDTFNEKYSIINTILASGKDFETMAKEAEAKGLDIRRDVTVNSFAAKVSNIPSSREVVSWALRSEEGDVNDKVFRCGESFLVIAAVAKHQKEGTLPFDEVKEQIRDMLTTEKRGDKLASNLAANNISSLEGYAEAMSASVDTIAGVSLLARGNVSSFLSAHAMATELNKISKPFRSGFEVIVVKPLTESNQSVGIAIDAQLQQQRRALGQGIGYRAFGRLVNDLKIEDNRARFY